MDGPQWELWVAAEAGDAERVAELLNNNPNLNVNQRYSNHFTPLVVATQMGHAAVVEIFLAHPDIHVNAGDKRCFTAFFDANTPEVMELLLMDERVDISPFVLSHLQNDSRELLICLIASGRDFEFIDDATMEKAAQEQHKSGREAEAELLRQFIKDPVLTRRRAMIERGYREPLAAWLFSAVVFLCDGYLVLKGNHELDRENLEEFTKSIRFLKIAQRLPIEMQMILSLRACGLGEDHISTHDVELALRQFVSEI